MFHLSALWRERVTFVSRPRNDLFAPYEYFRLIMVAHLVSMLRACACLYVSFTSLRESNEPVSISSIRRCSVIAVAHQR